MPRILTARDDALRRTDGAPLLIPAEQAFARLGVGRSKGFQLIAAGELQARKIGAKTMVEEAELQRFVASLPLAGRRAA